MGFPAIFKIIGLGLVAVLAASQAFATTSGITYQGRILKPDGSPLSGTQAQFKLQIRTPDTQSCLMFEETQTRDLSATNGSFSLTLNDGSGTRTDSTLLPIESVFMNRGSFALDHSTCPSGTGSYSPDPADGRNLVVLFKDETMSTWEPIPAQKINFVPFALEAKQVQGFTADSLLKVVDGSGNPMLGISPLSNAQYTILLGLSNGSGTSYTRTGTLNGVNLPTMSSGQVLGWNGTQWVSTSPVPAAGSITSTQLAAGAVTTTAVAGDVTINTSGTLGAAVTTTRDFKIYAASPGSGFLEMKAPAIPDNTSYTLTWPLDTGTSGQVLTTNGAGLLSWAAPAVTTQWTTHGSNISYDGGGNVGIGTTAPTGVLDVRGGTAATAINGSDINIVAQNAGGGTHSGGNIYLTPGIGSGGYPAGQIYVNVNSNNPAMSMSRNATDNYASTLTTAPAPPLTVNFSNGFFAAGNTAIEGFQARGANIQDAYFGAVSSAGASSYTPNLVWGQQTGATAYAERMRMDTNGNLGIGTTAPTAALHLKAGTAAASTAPLKLTSGPLLTATEDGAIEFLSPNLYFTAAGTRYVIPANTAAGNFSGVTNINNNAGSITMATAPSTGTVYINSNTPSNGVSSGALTVSGGAGITGDIYGGATIRAGTSVYAATSLYTPHIYGSTTPSSDITIDGADNAAKGNVLLAGVGGKVGIGTTAPGSLLTVSGNAAIGSGSTATAFSSVAIGDSARASGSGGVGIGFGSLASGTRSTAVGAFTATSGSYSLALGNAARAGSGTVGDGFGDYSVTIGAGNASGPRTVTGVGSIGMFVGTTIPTPVAANGVMAIMGGNVGIGSASPRSQLDVSGAILNVTTANATATIDFSKSNLQYTTLSCGAFQLNNMIEGGSYTLAVQGTVSGTCVFTPYSDAGTTAYAVSTNVHYPTDHAATVTGKHTLYTFLVLGGHIYLTWVPGL